MAMQREGARYYDAGIGRFISADNIQPDYKNPQKLNRYTYVLNNPLKYTDPTGHVELDSEEPTTTDEETAYWQAVLALIAEAPWNSGFEGMMPGF